MKSKKKPYAQNDVFVLTTEIRRYIRNSFYMRFHIYNLSLNGIQYYISPGITILNILS